MTPAGPPLEVELTLGAPAHGGYCVARHDGRVVLVRHGLPGERVVARVDDPAPTARFWRGEVVRVLEASPDRVPARCELARPGACGGCDLQHASPAAGRRWKAAVLREQLVRVGGFPLDDPAVRDLSVEPVPGDDEGLRWRTRVQYAIDDEGRAGFAAHRSHRVVPVERCPLVTDEVASADVTAHRWPGAERLEVAAAPGGEPLVVVTPLPGRRVRLPRLPEGVSVAVAGPEGLERVRGRLRVEPVVRVAGRERTFRVAGAGFWQVHPGAAQVLADLVAAWAAPRPGERCLDLYSGVGVFAAVLAEAVGPQGSVTAVESSPRAVADARRGLRDLPQVRLVTGRVEQALAAEEPGDVDVVVLDPPRTGAGPAVLRAVAVRRPRAVVLVGCDPAAWARDLATARELGWRVERWTGLDVFPSTHHVEAVALLVPAGPDAPADLA